MFFIDKWMKKGTSERYRNLCTGEKGQRKRISHERYSNAEADLRNAVRVHRRNENMGAFTIILAHDKNRDSLSMEGEIWQ
jgi:hypothetical protein